MTNLPQVSSADRVRAAAALRNLCNRMFEEQYPKGYIDSLARVARSLDGCPSCGYIVGVSPEHRQGCPEAVWAERYGVRA